MFFEFVVVKEKDLTGECPICYKEDSFLRTFPILEKDGYYKASKTVCQHCQTPFIGLDESNLPAEVKTDLDKGPVQITANSKDLEAWII